MFHEAVFAIYCAFRDLKTLNCIPGFLSMCSWMPPLSDLPYLVVSQGLEPLQSMAAFFSFFQKRAGRYAL